MKNLILCLFVLLFLSACQTKLPIISQMEAIENTPCQKDIEQIALADIDYLLFANRMVDAMIQDQNVQNKLTMNRIKLLIQPVSHDNNSAKVDMTAINTAIKNRIIRSGQFIIVDDEQSSNAHLSAMFENKKMQSDSCAETYEQFSMQLKNSRTGQIIWSDKKQFK